jgi:hypothetical protein
MMTVTTTAFHGILRSHAPTRYTVRCQTCRALVGTGTDRVDLDELLHECSDTTSGTREYEVVFNAMADDGDA